MTTIFRTKLASGFTVLPNSTLRDKSLSFRARGLLAFILSNSSEWEVTKVWLREQGKEGVRAINSALKELLKMGYAEKGMERTPDGKRFARMVWVFRDIPAPVSNAPVCYAQTRTAGPCSADRELQRSNKGKKKHPEEEPREPEVPPTPKALRASLAVDSPDLVDRLIQLWKEAWLERTGFGYISSKADRKRASAFLASGGLPPEAVIDVARRAFSAPDSCWASRNRTSQLYVFCESFNRIRQEVDSLVPRQVVTDYTKF